MLIQILFIIINSILMRSLDKYINNPVIPSIEQSLEKEQFKEERRINTLFKLNLRKILKDRNHRERINVICVNGRMYY